MFRPLTLRQVYGLNPLLPAQDLTVEGDLEESFVYISGNLTIIQKGDDQIILHGHTNDVSAFDISNDKSLIITGERSTIIVWSVATLTPLVIYENDLYDPISIKFNSSGNLFASLDSTGKTRIYSLEQTSPIVELTDKHALKRTTSHKKISFSTHNSNHLFSYGPSSLMFYILDLDKNQFTPAAKEINLTDLDIAANICDTKFLKETVAGVEYASSMSNGTLIIWKGKTVASLAHNRVIRLAAENEALTVLILLSENTIAIGSSSRRIRFYDIDIKLKNWMSNKHILPGIHGNITAISVKYQPDYNPESQINSPKKSEPGTKAALAESTLKGKPFFTKSLLVTTNHGEVIRIEANATTDHTKKSSILTHGKTSNQINAFACHTSQPMLAIGLYCRNTHTSYIELYDYEKESRIMRKSCNEWFKDGETISAVEFDGHSMFLAIGTTAGRLVILDALTLQQQFTFLLSTRNSGVVEKIIFNDHWLAVTDSTFAVTLFKMSFPDSGDQGNNHTVECKYYGRSRSHTAKITSLLFQNDILITVGYDRYMVEYDVAKTEYKGEQSILVPLREPTRLEQTSRPLDAVMHPPIPSKSNEQFLMTLTDHQKLRLFNTKTRLARRTTLAPLCGAQIDSIKIIPENDLLAFAAGTKIGLIQLPSDGNPWRQSAILAHPSGVESIHPSFCGKYLFSMAKSTGNHGCLQCWEVSSPALSAQLSMCPEGYESFISLMPHGREGDKFKQLKTYFYYASLLAQGIQTMSTREIRDSLPLSLLPDILRACGLFPTEKEVEDMSNEVLFWKYGVGDTDQIKAEVTLEEVIRLYVNYQRVNIDQTPVNEEEEFTKAMEQLTQKISNKDDTQLGQLFKIIQNMAEAVPEEELAQRMACLLNLQPPGIEQEWPKSQLHASFEDFTNVDMIERLPKTLTELTDVVFSNNS